MAHHESRLLRPHWRRGCAGGLAALCALAVPACGSDDSGGSDAGPDLPTWSRELPNAADAIGTRRGLSPARGIIHLHSPYSHDACDGTRFIYWVGSQSPGASVRIQPGLVSAASQMLPGLAGGYSL